MKLQVIDLKGNKTKEVNVDDNVFGIVPNESAMAQYLHVYRSNQRQGTASTKTRGEVHGTGKKPWRQKGTGRARVGTRTNPLWRKGGVAHGPSPKSWSKKVTKGLRSLAFRSALSYKVKNGKVMVLDSFEIKKPSTKSVQSAIDAIYKGDYRRLLLVLDKNDENFVKSARNIVDVNVTQVANMNTFEILNSSDILLVGDSYKAIEQKFDKKGAK